MTAFTLEGKMKEIKFYSDEHDWAITRCPYDPSTSKEHFDNEMPYVGSGGCAGCKGFVKIKDDADIVECKWDELNENVDDKP